VRARQLYEQILAIRPVPIDEILIWADKQTHPIIDIAEVNLELLRSGGMVHQPISSSQMAQSMPSQQPGFTRPGSIGPGSIRPGSIRPGQAAPQPYIHPHLLDGKLNHGGLLPLLLCLKRRT